MNIKIHFESAVEITRQTLLEMLDNLEHIGDASDVSLWDAINQVLEYVSTAEELEELENRPIRPEFFNILAQESLKTFYTGLSNGSN